MKAIDAHVGMKVIRTGNPSRNLPIGQIATIKLVKIGEWFEFEEFGQVWMAKYWEPHIEAIQEPFPVGSRVRVITKDHGIDQFGDEGILIPHIPIDKDFIYKVQFDNGERNNVYRLGDLELIKEADMPVEKEKKPFKKGDRVSYNGQGAGHNHFRGVGIGQIYKVISDEAHGVMRLDIPGVHRDRSHVFSRAFDLVEEEIVKKKEKHMLTRFVFASRGGKYYEKGDFNSLEAAFHHAQRLRRHYANQDIHPFVIVEE